MIERVQSRDGDVPSVRRGPNFLFIRHGVASGVEGRCIGHTDVPLSAEGADSIRALVSAWPVQLAGIRPRRLVSSDLRRAADSAAILGQAWSLEVEYDPRLREMSFGSWDGRLWSALEAEDGERFSAWMRAWTTAATPGGEGAVDVVGRARTWLEAQSARHDPPDTWVAVVSHAGWIRAAVSLLLGQPASEMFSIPVDHGRVTALRCASDGYERIASNVG